jgi:cell division topological specificity factor
MSLKEIIDRLLGRPDKNPRESARDRLKLVLMQDRSALPGSVMEQIRKEIIQVLARHCDIDESALDVSIERADGGAVALIANIPLRNARKEDSKAMPKKEIVVPEVPPRS